MAKTPTPLDGALMMFRAGFKVFPCVPNGKTPYIKEKNWQTLNLTEKQIIAYGTANPLLNWGIALDDKHSVLDKDIKENKNGFDTLSNIEANHNFKVPKTFWVTTPSGGEHNYFNTLTLLNTVSKLGPGLDTRGKGGYVVAPWSRINGKCYEPHGDISQIGPAPEALRKLLDEKKKREIPEGTVEFFPEGERNSRMISALAVQRSTGANSEPVIRGLANIINETMCLPPMTETEIDNQVKGAMKLTPQEAVIKQKDALRNIEAIKDFGPKLEKQKKHTSIFNFEVIKTIPKKDWVMSSRFLRREVNIDAGPGGQGKSLLAINNAVTIASGIPLSGPDFRVKEPQPVLIYNLEDSLDEVRLRVGAMLKGHNLTQKDIGNRIHIASGRDMPLKLVSFVDGTLKIEEAEIERLKAYIKEFGIAGVFIDPFVKTHCISENDNMGIDKVAQSFTRIATEANCFVNVAHHVRKQGKLERNVCDNPYAGDADILRGASALKDNARGVYTVFNMQSYEAEKYPILNPENYKRFVRADLAKANYQAYSSVPTWYEKISVELDNDTSVCMKCVPLVKNPITKKDITKAQDIAELLEYLQTKKGPIITLKQITDEALKLPYAYLQRYQGKADNTIRTWLLDLMKSVNEASIPGYKINYAKDESKGARGEHILVLTRLGSASVMTLDDMLL